MTRPQPTEASAAEPPSGGRRARGGAEARRAARTKPKIEQLPYITRKIPLTEVLGEEGLELIERNADTILEEVGIEFRDDEEALQLWKDAGADVKGTRVRFPRGLPRSIIQKSAPRQYTQHARNPERNVVIGGNHTVFAPVYGPPFIRSLDEGRRYATIEDFRNFVKLAYMSPAIHHSGGTVCEPVDLPVNKRHLDMVYSHIRYSDKPFMGSVTQPDRAADTVEMARILFGADFVENNTVITSLINANSPMVWDGTMLGALKVYARANQACIVTPFILAGAMSPVTAAGTLAQVLAEVLAGAGTTQLVRPGAPVIFGVFASSISMQSGAPTFGTPEPALVSLAAAQLARRLGIPFRTGGSLCASKIPDAQAAYESAQTLLPTVQAGTNFVLHGAGWLEGGLASGYEKFVMDTDQLGMMQVLAGGIDLSENGQALDAIREVGPGSHYLGCSHTQANFETAFYRSKIADNNSFEQWEAEGALDAAQRANKLWKRMLADYEAPEIDPGVDEALQEFIAKKKAAVPDSNV
ncbi:trimethylamine methyltransferase family protein [Rhodospirillaceae bacterium SYSU D60014]|uniref:trimethylamine methyltransferase family protein n=1 Tax=Virgifigura deserti TaxID=2268457 RepID=UPI000E671B60